MNNKDIDNQVLNNPLTKEEARKQFVQKTKELNLKHALQMGVILEKYLILQDN